MARVAEASAAWYRERLSGASLEMAAAWMTLATAILLHLVFWQNAGGLWRDEVVSYNVAAQASLRQTVEFAKYDSFPSLFHLILRGWLALGLGESDASVRGLGLLIGLGVLGSLWWNARAFGARTPLGSLMLVGLSGLVVRSTDAIRGYGVGVLGVCLCFAATWQFAAKPSRARWWASAACAVLSVQALYQNAFVVLGITVGAAVVCLRGGRRAPAVAAIGAGAVAALSLLVHLGSLRHMSEIRQLIAVRATLGQMLAVGWKALGEGNNWRLALWLAGVLTVFAACWSLFSARGAGTAARRGALPAPLDSGPPASGESPTLPGEVVLYVTTSVTVALTGFCVWLVVLGFPTQPWYYVPVMALTALAFDATWPVLSAEPVGGTLRQVRSVLAMVVIAIGIPDAIASVRVRQTNVDVLVARLESLVHPGDFVVVDQWYNGASFSRYYGGPAAWATLPPLADNSLQRLDLFKEQMLSAEPTKGVEALMEQALRAGRRVWLVGGLPLPGRDRRLELPGPAPSPRLGWDHDAYSLTWAAHAGQLLQRHAAQASKIDLGLSARVNEYENLPLLVVEGWRD